MNRRSLRIAVVGWACMLPVCQGCATILSDRKYPVTIDNPPGQTYFAIHDRQAKLIHAGVTPQQVTLDAKSKFFWPAKYKVSYAGQGIASETKELKADIDPWIAGNILVGGVPGLVVDGISGAMWKLPKRLEGGVPAHLAVCDPQQGEYLAKASFANSAPVQQRQEAVRQATATSNASGPALIR